MGKKQNKSKKSGPPKLSPAQRSDITLLVDQLIKKCAKVSSTSASPKEECEEFKQIYDVVEQIRALEKDIQLPKYDRDSEMTNFIQWASDNKIKSTGVSIEDFGLEGYGLKCTKNHKKGDAVLEVPMDAMIKERDAKNSYLASLIESDPMLQGMANVRLSLYFLLEYLNQDSKYGPYLRTLPQDFSYMPIYCTPDEVNSLKHTSVLGPLVRQYRNIGRQYAYFYRILYTRPEARNWPLKNYFTYDAYRWAVSCVCSRGNSIPVTNEDKQMALVPYWDLVNHNNADMITTDCLREEQKLVCFACDDFSSSQQFTMFYGRRTMMEFFLHCGFVPQETNWMTIKLGLSKTDSHLKEKTALLCLRGMEPVCELPICPDSDLFESQAFYFSMVFVSDEQQSEEISANATLTPPDLIVHLQQSCPSLIEGAKDFLKKRLELLVKIKETAVKGASETSSCRASLLASLSQAEVRVMKNYITILNKSDVTVYLKERTALAKEQ